MDAWDPDKPLPPDILARLLAVMPIKEHLPGQHDQDDHGRWAADKEWLGGKSNGEKASVAGEVIHRVTRGGDKLLTLRRYGANRPISAEWRKVSSRVNELVNANQETRTAVEAHLMPVLTKIMAETPFAGSEALWLQNADANAIKSMITTQLTEPADIEAAKTLLDINATDRAIQALRGLASNAPENPNSIFGRHQGEATYLLEDVDGKAVGIMRLDVDHDAKNVHIDEMVELGVTRGAVTMALGAAMKFAAEKNYSVTVEGEYISSRGVNGSVMGSLDWSEKLTQIGIPHAQIEGTDARFPLAVDKISAGDVQDWVNVALEQVDGMWGLPSDWKKDPTKPFDPPPSDIDTMLQHQKMVLEAKQSPSKGQQLSLEEIATVESWQSMDWRGINQAAAIMSENPVDGLIGSDLEGSDLDIVVEELDDIATRNSAEEDWILWRGVSAPGLKGNPGADPRREAGMIEAIRGAGEGGIIESGKFVSMTTDEAVAQSFADDRMLRINVPAATKGFWIENLAAANPDLPKFLGEKEFVAARGTKYRVDKIVEDDPEYGFYAELTVVP